MSFNKLYCTQFNARRLETFYEDAKLLASSDINLKLLKLPQINSVLEEKCNKNQDELMNLLSKLETLESTNREYT